MKRWEEQQKRCPDGLNVARAYRPTEAYFRKQWMNNLAYTHNRTTTSRGVPIRSSLDVIKPNKSMRVTIFQNSITEKNKNIKSMAAKASLNEKKL